MESLEYHIKNIGNDVPHQINLIEQDISGGKISKSTIDILGDTEGKSVLTVSGLKQETFEHLIKNYGNKFRVINFWKCPLVEDFSPIESLSDIEFISYFWNQRVTRLWDFSKTPKLKGFSFDDFTRLHQLADLEGAKSLVELEFGDKVWTKYKVDSLDPISNLTQLKSLAFSAKKVADGRIEPIANLVNLESLIFPGNLFSTEQVAWLRAKLPNTVKSKVLHPFWSIDSPLQIDGKLKDTFIVGKRKPFLDSDKDKIRIEKYVQRFNERVSWFKQNPGKLPHEFA